jgi:hypothetical protein
VLVQAREWTWTKKENWRLRLGDSDIFVAVATTCRVAFSLSEGARGAQRAVSCASTVELQSRRPALVRSLRVVHWLSPNRLWSSSLPSPPRGLQWSTCSFQ